MRAVVSTDITIRIVDDGGGSLGAIHVPCHANEVAAAEAVAAAIYTQPGVGWQFEGEAEQLPVAYKSWLESEDRPNVLGNLLEWLRTSGIEISTPSKEASRLLKEAACLA